MDIASQGAHADGTEQRAVITGGSRGIGFAVARRLVAKGAKVLLVARDPARLEAAVGVLNQIRPDSAAGLPCRVDGQERTARLIVDTALRQWGRVNLLLNAAGGATVASVLDAPWDVWRSDFEVKFWGYLSLLRAVMPAFKEAGGGVAVNILGVAGKDPNVRLPIASAINGALRNVTKVLADVGAADAIRIVNVNPGATETDLLRDMAQGTAQLLGRDPAAVLAEMRANAPFGRLPAADDIAQCVLFLMSSQAALITGTCIDVDEGVHRGPA